MLSPQRRNAATRCDFFRRKVFVRFVSCTRHTILLSSSFCSFFEATVVDDWLSLLNSIFQNMLGILFSHCDIKYNIIVYSKQKQSMLCHSVMLGLLLVSFFFFYINVMEKRPRTYFKYSIISFIVSLYRSMDRSYRTNLSPVLFCFESSRILLLLLFLLLK
jgi:hypothetical protein